MSYIKSIATFLLVGFLSLTLILYIFQRRLTYFPDRTQTKLENTFLSDVSEIILNTRDGERLVNWYAKAGDGKPTLLYFHGNGGALVNRTQRIALYQSHGFGVFMMSYRGYGGSSGSPTEHNVIADALFAYDWLVQNGVRAQDIVLYGESLGTGVAAQVAAQKDVKAVILEAPYRSLVEIGARQYPFVPVRLLMKDRYETIKYIPRVTAPILILHGALDGVIPVDESQYLLEKITSVKKRIVYKSGRHNDLYEHGAWVDCLNFLEKLGN